MLLIEVSLRDERSYWRLVEIVRGEEVHPDRREPDGTLVAHVLMTEEQYQTAVREGYQCRVLTDYATQPDPRDEISKTNRFDDELRQLRERRRAP